MEDKGDNGIVSGRLESEFLDDAGVMHVERIEPVVWLFEERVSLELGKRTHVDIGTFHLQFVHLAYLIFQSGTFKSFLPVRVKVILFGIFFKTELHVAHDVHVSHHLRNDFFTHLFVYLFCFLAAK